MGKKKVTSKTKINKKELQAMVTAFLTKHPEDTFTLKQFFSALSLTSHPLRMLCVDVLNELLEQGLITRNLEGEFMYDAKMHMMEGTFNRTSGGRNFVDTDDGKGISVYDEDTLHALPGDRVKVNLLAKRRGSSKLRGVITEIVKRSDKTWIGTL